MDSHNAGPQMIGYLYQLRYALLLLIQNDDPTYQISLEKFDDVAFDKDGEPKILIQLKHQVNPGSLSDHSVDLWRTLKEWIDAIKKRPSLLTNTDFVIITTARVPEESIASLLVDRKYEEAYTLLSQVANGGGNRTNKPFYDSFLAFPKKCMVKLLEKIKIISSASNITDTSDRIKNKLKYSCKREYIDFVFERIEGWWFKECIAALCSNSPCIATCQQVEDKILYIARQYGDDNLPFEFWNIEPITEMTIDQNQRIFIEQLRLLCYKSKMLNVAINDYYRASMQRSSWIRKGLIYIDELDDYENRLVYEWENAFASMQEDLDFYQDITEDRKIEAGRQLYSDLSNRDLRIRSKCETGYVLRGTYHILANGLKVGWHVDFIKRIQALVEGT